MGGRALWRGSEWHEVRFALGGNACLWMVAFLASTVHYLQSRRYAVWKSPKLFVVS